MNNLNGKLENNLHNLKGINRSEKTATFYYKIENSNIR